jgi:hypothetical protein
VRGDQCGQSTARKEDGVMEVSVADSHNVRDHVTQFAGFIQILAVLCPWFHYYRSKQWKKLKETSLDRPLDFKPVKR